MAASEKELEEAGGKRHDEDLRICEIREELNVQMKKLT
jgi:hypothetical protein